MVQLLNQPERVARAAKVLVETGLLRPERPDKAAEAALELPRWKMTPAAAFIVSAKRYPDDTAIIDERGSLTFEEVHRRSNALARALAEEGIGEGDGVAIMCRDHRWFIEATVAISKLGANTLLFNTAFAAPAAQGGDRARGPGRDRLRRRVRGGDGRGRRRPEALGCLV